MRIISFGGGVQTTALAILAVRNETARPDAIVFADTGDESPDTYDFMAIFGPWLEDRGLLFRRVRRDGLALVERYTAARRIPMRRVSSCTENYKIGPVRRWLRRNGCAKTTLRHGDDRPRVQIGISWDEMDRMIASDAKWIVNEYPLIDLRLNRDDCKAIIAAEGFEVPPKSGCMCCPWQSPRALVEAAERHPERIERIAVMEDRAIATGATHRLVRSNNGSALTVRQIVASAKARVPLFDLSQFEAPGCKTVGYCFK